ncbi:MAG: hypothetical protein ABIW79_03435 [Gemmatimonas sp.]
MFKRLKGSLLVMLPLVLPVGLPAAAALVACSGNADRGKPLAESASAVAAVTTDTRGRLASDATLTIEAPSALQAALSAAADSFASREAIRVVLIAPSMAHSPDTQGTPDLIVLTGNDTLRIRTDSVKWTLPFAELDSALVPFSPASNESVPVATVSKAKPVKSRTTKGKRLDTSITPRIAAVDSAALARARLMLLTVPASAPNSAVAERFVRYLLFDGRATLLRSGLHVLPRLEVHGDGAPPGIVSLADTVVRTDTSRTTAPSLGR